MDHEQPASADDRGGQDQLVRCSFCGKGQADVRKLIAGPQSNICDECVNVCIDILADDSRFDAAGQSRVQPGGAEAGPVLVMTRVLCRLPTTADEAVLIAERGAVCPGCAGEFEAAVAKKRDAAAF